MPIPKHISILLKKRKEDITLRYLPIYSNGVDFFSNDYLGFAQSEDIEKKTNKLVSRNKNKNGATGSRLISGNDVLTIQTEKKLASFYRAPQALLYTSGYNANTGVLSCIPQRNETILYDELVHASIREGVQLSRAASFKFKHNNTSDLESKLKNYPGVVYVVIESVYSMDGDIAPLKEILTLCTKYNAYLIVDEAHGVGVIGEKYKGLTFAVNHPQLFLRIVTFGKAIGTHGAVVLGSKKTIQYLINYSKPFIYTTALSPHSVATIQSAHAVFKKSKAQITLQKRIAFFNKVIKEKSLSSHFLGSTTAIQSLMVKNKVEGKKIAEKLVNEGFNVKAIFAPTVPEGKERIRICLHSYNTKKEITKLLELIQTSM